MLIIFAVQASFQRLKWAAVRMSENNILSKRVTHIFPSLTKRKHFSDTLACHSYSFGKNDSKLWFATKTFTI